MTEALALILFLLMLALSLGMFIQGLRYRVELLSVRNFFLLGIIFFQLLSGGVALWTGEYSEFGLTRPLYAGAVFTIVITAFLAVFLFTYRLGWISDWMARRFPVSYAPTHPVTMLMLAGTFLVLGVLMRMVISHVPVLGVLSGLLSTGLLAVAAGMAVWAWMPRLWNPALAGIAIGIIMLAVFSSFYGTFGRRDTMNVLLACGWAGYYSTWRYLGVPKALFRLSTVAAVGIVLLALFSATRGNEGKGRDPMQALVEMAQADLGQGMTALVSTQQAGPLSMWLCESKPSMFPYDTLHQARFFISQPIPRQFWHNKPGALGRIMVDQRNLTGYDTNFTVGPGLAGHIVNDNPWIALIPYAVFAALVIRFMDSLINIHVHNPFVVLPIGVALAEIFGTARGEAALFMFMALFSSIGAWIGMAVSAQLLQLLGVRVNAGTPWTQEEEDREYAESEALNDVSQAVPDFPSRAG